MNYGISLVFVRFPAKESVEGHVRSLLVSLAHLGVGRVRLRTKLERLILDQSKELRKVRRMAG